MLSHRELFLRHSTGNTVWGLKSNVKHEEILQSWRVFPPIKKSTSVQSQLILLNCRK